MDDYLGIEEFQTELLERVSCKIVSRTYLEENEDFINEVVFDMFKKYLEGYSITSLSDILESFFYSLFLYSPKTVNSEEVIDSTKY